MTAANKTGSALSIRHASESDAEAIRSIYNHYVLNSVFTFDTSEQSLECRLDWLKQHLGEQLPVLVAEVEGEVVGWASLSYYHSRCAYRTTVEFSAYLRPEHHGKGIGKALVQELLALAEAKGYHVIVGLICSENQVSIRMAESLGFEKVGELREVGRKFDRWLNVTFVEKILNN